MQAGLSHATGGQMRIDLHYRPCIEALPNGKNPKVVNLTDRRY
jgi:hypothetical protein